MDFKTFKDNLRVVDKTESSILRNKYIKKFINTEHELYRKQIQTRHKFSDGFCYLGYLWDYLNIPFVIDKNYIETVATIKDKVYVFWDIHSCERIFIADYWKFDKDAVLKLRLEMLLRGEKYLPEDIYIFDDSLEWTLIKTHEDINGKCYCLKSGKI